MNRPSQAISILEQARDILMARLVERVIENREEILEDARGESYLGEIEALHEQIGARLAHLTQILASLPPHSCEVASPGFGDEDGWSPAQSPAVEVDLAFASGSPGAASEFVGLSWQAASGRLHEPNVSRSALLSLQAVSARVQTGELETAGRILAALFELSPDRSGRCVEFFAGKAAADAACVSRMASLRHLLETADSQSVTEILQDCFGFSESETRKALELLSGRRSG